MQYATIRLILRGIHQRGITINSAGTVLLNVTLFVTSFRV
jgi:hypothetical protein